MKLWALLLCCGCAMLDGDFVLSRSVSGVQTRTESLGASVPFRTVEGYRLASRQTILYVSNGTGRVILADVTCTDSEWTSYKIQAGHEQGFIGKCKLKSWRFLPGDAL